MVATFLVKCWLFVTQKGNKKNTNNICCMLLLTLHLWPQPGDAFGYYSSSGRIRTTACVERIIILCARINLCGHIRHASNAHKGKRHCCSWKLQQQLPQNVCVTSAVSVYCCKREWVYSLPCCFCMADDFLRLLLLLFCSKLSRWTLRYASMIILLVFVTSVVCNRVASSHRCPLTVGNNS